MLGFLFEIALLAILAWAAWRFLRYGFALGPSPFSQTTAVNACFALFAVTDIFLEAWPAAPVAFALGLLLIALRSPNPKAGVEKGHSRVGRATRDWLVIYAGTWAISSAAYKFDLPQDMVGYGLATLCSATLLYSAARRTTRVLAPSA